VVEVALGCWHAASGENAGRVLGFDLSGLVGAGSSSGGPVVDDLAFLVGDGVSPFGI